MVISWRLLIIRGVREFSYYSDVMRGRDLPSTGRDCLTIQVPGVTAHLSQAGQHPEKEKACSLVKIFRSAPLGQAMPRMMGSIMILSAYQE